jgi:hypothetical protein
VEVVIFEEDSVSSCDCVFAHPASSTYLCPFLALESVELALTESSHSDVMKTFLTYFQQQQQQQKYFFFLKFFQPLYNKKLLISQNLSLSLSQRLFSII